MEDAVRPENYLLPGERLDDLGCGLKIIQNPRSFCFGTDSVLLSSFANVKKNERVVDLGTGSGVLLLLLSARSSPAALVGVEIQPDVADMARRSVALNGMEGLVSIREMAIQQAAKSLGYGAFDCAVCNPPYAKAGGGPASPHPSRRVARQETSVTLAECVAAAAALLRNGGRAYFIHQGERLFELWQEMRLCRLEPKRTRLVCPSEGRPPNLALCEGVKNGNPGLMWLPPLYVFENGQYSTEIDAIYHRPELVVGLKAPKV